MKRAEIERLLPSIVQRAVWPDSPLAGILDAMEALHAPSEAKLARLDAAFDPRRTEDDFVPLLARWVDLDRLFHEAETAAPGPRPLGTITTGLGRLRELVASAAYLSKWRGTAKGLHRFLQTATGEREFEIKENVDSTGRPKPFHIAVTAPASLTPHRTLLERIIESEKPAYVTYELVFSTKN